MVLSLLNDAHLFLNVCESSVYACSMSIVTDVSGSHSFVDSYRLTHGYGEYTRGGYVYCMRA